MITKFSDSGTPYVIGAPETTKSNSIFDEISKNLITTVDNLTENLSNKPIGSYNPKEGFIIINHDKDKVKKISPFHLRSKCICAACVDEFSGKFLLIEGKKILQKIKDDVYPLKMEEKGNYAIAVVWSDGHRSSIYPYKRLLSSEIESIL